MTRTLILFRHAKSDWDADFDTDHNRPLAKRGFRAAKTMGRMLAKAGQFPDRILTSSAVRAKTTVELAAQEGKWNRAIEVTPALYETEPDQVLTLIQQTSDAVNSLMLVGHEPTSSTLTSQLMGGGQLRLPTAAMVRLDFETDSWSQIHYGQATLIWLLQPKFFTQF